MKIRACWGIPALFLLVAVSPISCTSAIPTSVAATPTPTGGTGFADPFSYCAAVGTIDTPDARYAGPKVPELIAKKLQQATGAAADAPLSPFVSNSFWRCMDGKVYGCFVGANLPCQSKADSNRTPTTSETVFCRANPTADAIPAAVTGRETVYEWRCTNGAPQIVRQVFHPDARGFISEIWHPLSRN